MKRHEGDLPKAVSWVSVVQEKKVLRKYNLNVTDLEGQLNMVIPDEVVINVNALWEDFLIENFMDTLPHISRIHDVLKKIWREGDKGQVVEVHEVDSSTMKLESEMLL